LIDCGAEPVFFLDDQFVELSLSSREITEFSKIFRERGCDSGFHEQCEIGDDPSIDGVGFCELIAGSGEVAHLSRIDDSDDELVFVEVIHEFAFVTAGRFEADELRIFFFQEDSQLFEAGFGVGECSDFRVVRNGDVKFLRGDIDSDADFVTMRHAEALPCQCELVLEPLWRLYGLKHEKRATIWLRYGLSDRGQDDLPLASLFRPAGRNNDIGFLAKTGLQWQSLARYKGRLPPAALFRTDLLQGSPGSVIAGVS